MKDTGTNQAKLMFILSMIIFGTIGIIVRSIELSSSLIAFARGLIGTVFLVVLVKMKGNQLSWSAIKRNIAQLLISGVFIGANWILLFEAYRYTFVSVATLCYYMAPVFVILSSPFALREKLTKKKLICVCLALTGMVCISGVLQADSQDTTQMKGVFFGLGAAILYAGVVLVNKKLPDVPSYDLTIMQLGIATIVMFPYILLTENFSFLSISTKSMLLLLLAGILHTGIAYALYFSSMKKMKALTVAIFSYIDPIVAVLLSAFLLKERMSLIHIIGAILILASTFVSEIHIKQKG